MKAIGIDIGHLTTKSVVMEEDGTVLGTAVVPSAEEPERSARAALKEAARAAGRSSRDGFFLVTTGTEAKEVSFSHKQKSLTTCLARGVARELPAARLVVDVGAESSTIVRINERGRVTDWANHDKCAAGTGIFLQQMAKLLEMSLEEMAAVSVTAAKGADITPTCAVFAESEVISHIHRVPPTPRDEIARGIFESVVSRLMSMAKRIGVSREVAVTGGVALNAGLVKALEREFGFPVLVGESPQLTAAAGAAVLALESIEKGMAP
jgi:predicted CoA-substrate-specific enzyme activase